MKWNKLTVRELTKEEQEEYGLLLIKRIVNLLKF